MNFTNTQPTLTPAQIREARKTLGYSRVDFAVVMGCTSQNPDNLSSLVQKWEEGTKTPSPCKIRLMLLLLMEQSGDEEALGHNWRDLTDVR